ncbi:MAG: IS4 family transposase [Magnetococcales bacterium]|nr:IS4 family transposase [Magnetococcales bacterium]
MESRTLKDEIAGIDLGDKRLNQRACAIIEQLGRQPSNSIPSAIGGWSETKSAYNLLANEDINAQKILEPHYQATIERMKQHPLVLVAQDTTELDYTGKNDIEGLGTLNSETRKGLYLHPSLAITPERLSLGQVSSWSWTRPFVDADKESIRWIEGYQRICDIQQQFKEDGVSTKLVSMADREGDIYDLFVERERIMQRGGIAADWLIRSQHDRKTEEGEKIRALLAKAPSLGEITFNLPKGRENREARPVVQTLRVVSVPVSPPKKGLPVLTVTAILAREEHPPKGTKPVQWILITNLTVATLEEAKEKLDWYLCRWQIEVFFKILKSGCKVEELQLEKIDRIENALAFYQIIAWRILYLTMLGRECPELPCNLVFEDQEWQAVYIVTTRERPPEIPPSLGKIIRMVAGYGGFLNRKSDGFPGSQTIWIGLQRCRDFVLGVEAQKDLDGKRR